jgi:hypothetical protein
MPQRAYSTDNPEAVAAFRQARADAIAFGPKIDAATKALGKNGGALFFSGGFDSGRPAGLNADDPNDPPEGWIFSKTKDHLVPRRGKPGDPARAWIEAHKRPADALTVLAEHGLPRYDRLGGGSGWGSYRLGSPEVLHHEGVLWARYRGEPDGTFGGPKECTWLPRKLSEYYAAREAVVAVEEAQAVAP